MVKSKTIKRCSNCGRFLSEDCFYWKDKKKCLLHSHCKRCGRNIAYLWRLDNPEYNKQYRDNNKEYFVKYSKQYYKDNPEYFKQYCQDNKEHHNNYNKQWYKNNKEHKKQYYQDNKEHYSKYHKQYRKDNRGKRNAAEAKRKTLKLNQTVFLTEIEKKRILILYKFSHYLGKYFVVDHIQPISKGGSHYPDNLQILTKKLNREKYDKWPLTEGEQIKYQGLRI